MTLPEIEQKIYDYYQWFHQKSPGTSVQETGVLAEYWALFDREVSNG